MKKKIVFVLMICLMCFTGCNNKSDYIDIYNKSNWTLDDVGIPIKPGYFYNKHEKFTVDENTIGVTIYFSKEDDSWD